MIKERNKKVVKQGFIQGIAALIFFESAYLDEPENKNANIGQANASVYCIGPQYDVEIPVKIIISISTIRSITK